VEIDVNGDVTFDGTDQMKLILTGATNARIADGEATGTITDDDARPVVSIETPESILEDADKATTAGQTRYEFKVKLDHASDENGRSVCFDRQRHCDQQAPTSRASPISVSPSRLAKPKRSSSSLSSTTASYEANQSFDLVLSDPLRATLAPIAKASGTIVADDDAKPTIQITGQSILEGDNGERFISFTVQRAGATDEVIKFNFETIDGTATAAMISKAEPKKSPCAAG
jgi:hypothetical protein